jgi:hypothetical protein
MAPKKGNPHALQHGHDAGHSDAPRCARLDEMPPLESMHAVFMLHSALNDLLCIWQFTGLYGIARNADEDYSTIAEGHSFLLVSQKSGQKSLPVSPDLARRWAPDARRALKLSAPLPIFGPKKMGIAQQAEGRVGLQTRSLPQPTATGASHFIYGIILFL